MKINLTTLRCYDYVTETGTKMQESFFFFNDTAKHLIMLEHILEKCFS